MEVETKDLFRHFCEAEGHSKEEFVVHVVEIGTIVTHKTEYVNLMSHILSGKRITDVQTLYHTHQRLCINRFTCHVDESNWSDLPFLLIKINKTKLFTLLFLEDAISLGLMDSVSPFKLTETLSSYLFSAEGSVAALQRLQR